MAQLIWFRNCIYNTNFISSFCDINKFMFSVCFAGHIELIALIFVINLPLLFASTALAPISFMPNWLGWLASLNPLTFAIEPIRTAYTQTMDLELVALHAPYGDLTCKSCISILFSLTVFSLIIIRPLLNRKLN